MNRRRSSNIQEGRVVVGERELLCCSHAMQGAVKWHAETAQMAGSPRTPRLCSLGEGDDVARRGCKQVQLEEEPLSRISSLVKLCWEVCSRLAWEIVDVFGTWGRETFFSVQLGSERLPWARDSLRGHGGGGSRQVVGLVYSRRRAVYTSREHTEAAKSVSRTMRR